MDAGTLLGSGRYEVLAPLGEGAMGTVTRARRVEDGHEVAIKRLRDPRHAVRFEIEARLLERLDHPRVARVLDYFTEGGHSHLVMDLVDGETLLDVLRRDGSPGLPVEDVVGYAREVCEALEYVHKQYVVHRDVKPSNLVLSERGVVLVDFGVAREASGTEAATIGVGTPAYMAPEVLVGGIVSARADVYSVAATSWTLLTGRPPSYGELREITDVVPEAGPELAAVLRAALALEPAARPASASAFASALGAPIASGGGASLARIVERPHLPASTLAAVARAAAGVLQAAAVSIAVSDPATGEIVYEAAWGAGAHEIIGVRLAPGTGIAGSVLATGVGVAVANVRTDPRFGSAVAARTGYVPRSMVVVPLRVPGLPPAILQALDRRGERPYGEEDLEIAEHAADLVEVALAPRADEAPTVRPG